MTDEELRARLLSEAGKAIDKMLAERPAANKITLRDIERLAVQAGTELSSEIQEALGDEGSEGHSGEEEFCPECGARMQRRGQVRRRVVTEAGSSQLERVYCVCPSCGYSFFPLRRGLGVG